MQAARSQVPQPQPPRLHGTPRLRSARRPSSAMCVRAASRSSPLIIQQIQQSVLCHFASEGSATEWFQTFAHAYVTGASVALRPAERRRVQVTPQEGRAAGATTPTLLPRTFSPYSSQPPSTSHSAVRGLQAARSASPAAQTTPPGARPTDQSASWLSTITSPFLSNPEGYQQYQDVSGAAGDFQALPKYHFSLAWANAAMPGSAAALAPSAESDVEDALRQLDVDRSGLRCVAALAVALVCESAASGECTLWAPHGP